MNGKKICGLIGLAIFAMMQISACFVAGANCEGFWSIFFYAVGGVSCLFGVVLNFLLLIIAVDVFGSVFGVMAESFARKQSGEDDEEDEIEFVETVEDNNSNSPRQ